MGQATGIFWANLTPFSPSARFVTSAEPLKVTVEGIKLEASKKLAQYDADPELRQRLNAVHGGKAEYAEFMWQNIARKMAGILPAGRPSFTWDEVRRPASLTQTDQPTREDAETERRRRSMPGLLTQEGQRGHPAPLASRFHRIPSHLRLDLHAISDWSYQSTAPLTDRELSPQVKAAVNGVKVGLLPSSATLRARHRPLLELAAVLDSLATATKTNGAAKKAGGTATKATAGKGVSEGIAVVGAAVLAARRVVVPRSTKAPTISTSAKATAGMRKTTEILSKTPGGAAETKLPLFAITEKEDCSDSGPATRQDPAAEDGPCCDPAGPAPATLVGQERLADWLEHVVTKLEHPATRADPVKMVTLTHLAARLQTRLRAEDPLLKQTILLLKRRRRRRSSDMHPMLSASMYSRRRPRTSGSRLRRQHNLRTDKQYPPSLLAPAVTS
jgi:hypothetical protein